MNMTENDQVQKIIYIILLLTSNIFMSKIKSPSSLFLSIDNNQTINNLLYCTQKKHNNKQQSVLMYSENKQQKQFGELSKIKILFFDTNYDIYYKNQGTIRDFMNYFSNLKKEQFNEVCVVINLYTKQILSLETKISEIQGKDLYFALIEAKRFISLEWKKTKQEKYQAIDAFGNYFWVEDIKTITYYTELLKGIYNFNDILKQTCWYFGKQFIANTKYVINQNEFNYFFPTRLNEQIYISLLKNQFYGFKIFKSFECFLFSIGLQIKSIHKVILDTHSNSIFKQTMQRADYNQKFLQVMEFLSKTGYRAFAEQLYKKIKKYIDIDLPEAKWINRENQFIILYKKSTNHEQFLKLIVEKMTNQFRVYQFLKEKVIYQFRESNNPYQGCLDDFKLHTFEDYSPWFFPIFPEINIEEASRIKQSKRAGRNILSAYKKYLDIFDIQLDDTNCLIKKQNTLAKFRHPLNKIHYVERIIFCLSIVGFRVYAKPLIIFLKQINMPEVANVIRYQSQANIQQIFLCDQLYYRRPHKLIRNGMDICGIF